MASIAVRTPMERFFAANDKADQKEILSSGVKYVKKFCDEKGIHFSYMLTDKAKDALSKSGICLHPVPFLSHSHPFSKTVENHLLINVLPGQLGNGRWVFSSIKNGKVESIVKKAGGVKTNIDIVNKCVCAKDFGRYEFTPNEVDIKINVLSREHLFPKSYLNRFRRSKVFIHDEVHHWGLNDMVHFLRETEVKILLCTVVYPPELLAGITTPQNREFYDYKVEGDKFFFFPDGCKSEGYEQSQTKGSWIFKASGIEFGDKFYTVKLISSLYAHHMFQISLGRKCTESKRFFGNFNTIDLQVIHEQRFRMYDYIPIRKHHIEKIYTYLLCLKKPDVESAIAKLRQIMEDESDCRVVEFFCKFAKDIITKFKGKIDLYEVGWIESAKDFFLNRMPLPVRRLFDRWGGMNIFNFLFTLETLQITVNTKVLREGDAIEIFKYEPIKCDVLSCDLPGEIDNLFTTGKISNRIDSKIKINIHGPIYDGKGVKRMHIMDFLHSKHLNDSINSKTAEEKKGKRKENLRIEYHKEFSELPSFFRDLKPVCSRTVPVNQWVWLKSKQLRDSMYIKTFVDPIYKEIENGLKSEIELFEEFCSDECRSSEDEEEVIVDDLQEAKKETNFEETSIKEDVRELENDGNFILSAREMEVNITFEHTKANSLIKIKGDGNCFYRAIRKSILGNDDDYMSTKRNIVERCDALNVYLSEQDRESILSDGICAEEWMVKLAVNVLGIKLEMICDMSSTSKEVMTCSSITYSEENGFVAKLIRSLDHFDVFIEDDEEFIEDTLFNEGFDEFESLNDLVTNELANFKKTSIKGREAYFLVENHLIDYKHGKTQYIQNLFCDINQLLPKHLKKDYNALLIQIFDEGSGIGFHRDDEKCYSNDSILSINLKGEATFLIDDGEIKSIELRSGMWIQMLPGFQKRNRHSVRDCSKGRINVTFRRHVKSMRGKELPAIPNVDSIKNACLIRAIANNEKRFPQDIINALLFKDEKYWTEWITVGGGSSIADLIKASDDLKFDFSLLMDDEIKRKGDGSRIHYLFSISKDHIEALESMPSCKISSDLDPYLSKKGEGKGLLDDDFFSELDKSHWNKVSFECLGEAAAILQRSFLDRTSGKFLSDVYGDRGKNMESVKISPDCSIFKEIEYIAGFAGSGKSHDIQIALKDKMKGKFVVISPRKNLAEDWKVKVPRAEKKVLTFEVALTINFRKPKCIIIDELGLYPNGYLDLICFMLDSVKNYDCQIVCLFDPIQARYHSDNDCGILHEEHEVDRLIMGSDVKYLAETRRLNPNMRELFPDIKIWGNDDGSKFNFQIFENHLVAINELEKKGIKLDCMLVASRDEKKALCSKVPTMTFGESQGLTFDHVLIVLSEYSEKQDDLRWMVALTRARKSINFSSIYRGGIGLFLQNNVGRVNSCFLTRSPITLKRMNLMIKGNLVPFIKKNFKSDEVDREDRLEGDLYLKPFIFLGQRINSEEIEIVVPEIVEPVMKSHVFLAQENFATARNFDLIRAKEMREFRMKGMETNQFCHDFNKVGRNGIQDVAGPLRFESIFPRHKSDDDLTFWMAVKKRLRFSEESIERAKLKEAGGVGSLLYNNFKEKMNLSFSWDQQLLEECINDFEVKKLKKSKATLAAHSLRSDSDWALNDVFLFMKSQLCTKFEKQYVDAKAGQTLACFSHLILVKFAPYCRYMEKMLARKFGSKIYIHSNKNFDQLNSWVIENIEQGIKVESDYEAFDASQDEYILAFEIELMHDIGMPNWMINDYIDLKCTLGCKLGQFAIMRFTGEFCTFLFNTLANMAFTLAKYDCDEKTPMAFAGDDMCILRSVKEIDNFDDIMDRMSLKAKVVWTETPMFCGWNLSRHGIVKEPELIYNRFMVAKERGNVDECLENYAIEASYAYSLGERLYEVLKREEQIEYHQLVVRYIVKRISKLKTSVKTLYSNQDV